MDARTVKNSVEFKMHFFEGPLLPAMYSAIIFAILFNTSCLSTKGNPYARPVPYLTIKPLANRNKL
jgi:hypothetical protein